MSWFTNLRMLAFARRAVRALESLATSQSTLARIADDDWRKRNAPRLARKAEFATLDILEVNKRYRLEQEAKMVGEEDE